ncbi:MAG TPA: iron permease, partial [Anaerolineae bacterium]|nr:iron permease [Anaerolineae bacterium]
MGLILTTALPALAQSASPADSAEQVRRALVDAQLAMITDPAGARDTVSTAQANYAEALSPQLSAAVPEANARIETAFAAMLASAEAADSTGFAAARSQAWTAMLEGGYQSVEAALQKGDAAAARAWLGLREYRTANRYSRAGADATLAVEQFAAGELSAADAALTVRADLYDTYQARLSESLRDLADADANGFAGRRAELAALAAGYFAILAPAYAEQRGADALASASNTFDNLTAVALSGDSLAPALDAANGVLDGFRAAPLSPAEQARRAGQLLRFVGLISVEYGRAISDGRVIHDFEIQEAVTFHEAAYAAFSDLSSLLPAETTAQAAALFDQLSAHLSDASPAAAAEPSQFERETNELMDVLKAGMPETWLASSSQGDFAVIASLLDQVESAVASGEYDMADSARLEAYATLETGPEA